MKKNIVSYGELLWDLLPGGRLIGGAPFNFIYRVNSLGDSGVMISRLGMDNLGHEAFGAVCSLGLDTRLLQRDDILPTGTVDVVIDESGHPDFTINPNVAYDAVTVTDDLLEAASKADCICFGTLIQRSAKSRETLETLLDHSGVSLKFLDIKLRKDCYSRETVLFSLERADILKMNETEVSYIAGLLGSSSGDIPELCVEIAEKWSLKHCLVTFAEKGAFAFSHGGYKVYEPGYKIKLADSVGSGDAFSAGFLHEIMLGSTLKRACRAGNILGALVATKKGGTTPVAPDEIAVFSEQPPDRILHPDFERYL